MRREPRPIPFASEAALCDMLRERATELGWLFYPEQGGWDCLLVLPDGEQVGVQAKLRSNLKLVWQVMPDPESTSGPDMRAVLVPRTDSDLCDVCRRMRVMHLDGNCLQHGWEKLADAVRVAHRFTPTRRVWLPPFVPTHASGVPSPYVVSPWKIALVKVCARLRAGEVIASNDFGDISVAHLRAHLERVPGPGRARYRYKPTWSGGEPMPDVEHAEIALALGLPDPREKAAVTA